MTELLVVLQITTMIIFIYYMVNNNKGHSNNKVVIERENVKEMDKLNRMRSIQLTQPLTEKSRPTKFEEIIGQEDGIKALKAALCGPNPQHVIIYGPPGVGKTAAARLVLEEAKKVEKSPFKKDAKFIEIDATTIRFDERGIADPLIGSVHDPIYQGAGSLGVAGIPQPKPGAVTKAHGGMLFMDEIGELHPIELNKLLKVLEDRKVFLDSSYYSSENPNMPDYIKEIFDNGLPADFRLIGATTRSPEEIVPAIRSRCVEIFFRSLHPEEIKTIGKNAANKVGLEIDDKCLDLISKYCTNGRDVVNLIQLSSGVAINENRSDISIDDIQWVIENGNYTQIPDKKVKDRSEIGVVNGLAVHGANIGILMEIEATAKKVTHRIGNLKVTGIVEEEEISSNNRKIKRKSTAYSSIQNVLTVLNNIFNLECENYDIHINIPGGMPVDGPSAGITIATAIYSAINKVRVSNKVAMTGEISLLGEVKPIGGVNAKINAAQKAGATKVIIPIENWKDSFKDIAGIKVIAVKSLNEVIEEAILKDVIVEDMIVNNNIDILSAKGEE
ncbi:ATP-dependent protease LonB [Clostridium tertium]|jgi:ATP-dependent Lon protease|uniref:endopeptidase La n=1 Tax=Clostridium tertium TaxID=1559 RepID=A0A9X3XP04_9CLOT|nr:MULTISPECIES: ATP-dependent protease LonB [Clostridium]EEH99079.1 ATP-dependent protease LonB [Clostridium sp. 7_2_43FAA]MBP1867789.1 Lon-like ATP-dependent protease [Clostridium tertium]MBU6137053.1 ATP-dependent protease LonB [Clostridium tertium]MDB1921415.1 ATP-dependent protease LonB [Clostridium tertium]MDB1924660.1 ATP-dependent protease LonB [Clostridium tertium]